jgi:hypothetical protein
MPSAWQSRAISGVPVANKRKNMTTTDLNTEKHCIVLGGLEGGRFVKTLAALRSDLSQLETFVADLNDAVDVGPRPMACIGYEVDRDAIIIDHLDERLGDTISRLIDLTVVTRTARAALQRAENTRAKV